MAEVIIEGMFMNAEIKTTTFDGKSRTDLVVDIYQKDSSQNNKSVTLKTDNLELKNKLDSVYDFGSVISVKAGVNAYKNVAYYRLLDVVS